MVIFTSSYNIYENMHHTSYALQYAIKNVIKLICYDSSVLRYMNVVVIV